MSDSISIIELKKLLTVDPSIKIIDIRDNLQYNLGSIPRAINIPMNFLTMMPEKYLDKNNIYYICCEYGRHSKELCHKLNSLNYKTVSVVGGYHDYLLKRD